MTVGIHVLANLHGCQKKLLEKVEAVRTILQKTVSEANLNQVGESFHQFAPNGVTGVIILSESHMSVHTWPEKNLAVIDIFTCGNEGNAEKAFEILSRHFNPKNIEKKIVNR